MKLFKLILPILFLFSLAANVIAQDLSFTDEVYKTWIDMRVGDGETPAYWYAYGDVYSYPDGELLAKMQGVDVAQLVPVSKDSCIQLNRKIFLYLDKDTGEVLREMNGQPVSHIKYPYQMIEYVKNDNGKLITYVTQGSGKGIRRIGPGSNTMVRKKDNTYFFSSPVFLNFETPRGKYEAVENYDFLVHTDATNLTSKYQLTWWRYGALAPFFGKKQGTIQLVCYRAASFEDLPDPLRTYIKEEAQLWMKPPQNLAEIKQLQAQ